MLAYSSFDLRLMVKCLKSILWPRPKLNQRFHSCIRSSSSITKAASHLFDAVIQAILLKRRKEIGQSLDETEIIRWLHNAISKHV